MLPYLLSQSFDEVSMNRTELEKAIKELESKPDSYTNMEKLSHLYNVYNQHYDKRVEYSRASMAEEQPKQPDSNFIKMIQGKDSQQVFQVLDELMEVLYITNEKLYLGVMRKLDKID